MADQQQTLESTAALLDEEPAQIAALAADLLGLMRKALDRAAEDPFSNPVMTTALAISRRLDQGLMTDADLSGLVCWLRDEAYQQRAQRIADYVGLSDGVPPEEAMAEMARRIGTPGPERQRCSLRPIPPRGGAHALLGRLYRPSDLFAALSHSGRAGTGGFR